MSLTRYSSPSFEVGDTFIPAIGLGTFQGDSGNERVKEVVLQALKLGYRHIDTAAAYGNEEQVGAALRDSGIARTELFVTTKLAQTWHSPSDVEEALDRSLAALQLEYVDLYLMHFPHAYAAGPDHSTLRHPDGKPIIDHELSRGYTRTWTAMERLVEKGKVRLIGLSNFNVLKLRNILSEAKIRPSVNQVELHPYLPQTHLLQFCQRENIHLMAHQPLGGRPVAVVAPNRHRSGPLSDPDIKIIASQNEISPAQVLISWAVQRGTSVIPKAASPEHMLENYKLFQLSAEDMKRIDDITGVGDKCRVEPVRFLDPRGYLGFDIFNEEMDEPAE